MSDHPRLRRLRERDLSTSHHWMDRTNLRLHSTESRTDYNRDDPEMTRMSSRPSRSSSPRPHQEEGQEVVGVWTVSGSRWRIPLRVRGRGGIGRGREGFIRTVRKLGTRKTTTRKVDGGAGEADPAAALRPAKRKVEGRPPRRIAVSPRMLIHEPSAPGGGGQGGMRRKRIWYHPWTSRSIPSTLTLQILRWTTYLIVLDLRARDRIRGRGSLIGADLGRSLLQCPPLSVKPTRPRPPRSTSDRGA